MHQLKFVLIFLFIFNFPSLAQIPNWQWAKSYGGVSVDQAKDIAVDGDENSYITGSFRSSSVNLDTVNLINSNSNHLDLFIAKLNAQGGVEWAVSANGQSDDFGASISVDIIGNVYVVGSFYSPTLEIGTFTLFNSGSSDIFLIKLNSRGDVIWAKSYGGNKEDVGEGVAIDDNGNVYFTGAFNSDTINFDTFSFSNVTGLDGDIFGTKLDSLGNVLWATAAGSEFADAGKGIAIDNQFNIYISGTFQGPVIHFGNDSLIGSGMTDIFIVKFDSVGNVVWLDGAGGVYEEMVSDLLIDPDQNIVLTGTFTSNNLIFDTINLNFIGGITNNIYLVKYDSFGSVIWAKGMIGGGIDMSNVAVDQHKNLYLAGIYGSPSITFGVTTLVNSGVANIFIAKFDSAGNSIWAKSAGGSFIDGGFGLDVSHFGNIFLTGFIQSPVAGFDQIFLSIVGDRDLFIAKLDNTNGIFRPVKDNDFLSVYPNPSEGNVIIFNKIEMLEVKIYNSSGQLIQEHKPNSEKCILQIESKGLYLINVSTRQNSLCKRFLVLE